MSRGRGAFNGTICALASRCQAVAVIVNARLDPPQSPADGNPFLVMAAVPRTGEQSRVYDDSGVAKDLGVLDPNQPLADAMTWLAATDLPG